jgi:UDP-N-acetylglucosamine 4,6-dehydratase
MKLLKDKVILITGGTGSFGNAVVDKLLPLHPKKIIIFSRDELKQELMRNKYATSTLHFVIGDIRDRESLDRAMVGVDYVFHAAALKQVPAGEIYPMEYIKTNTLGGINVIDSAIKAKVKRVVVLTTDKAVYPVNAMGMSKALMEKYMTSMSKNKTTILCGVRYGNVLYSRGSVVPFFVSLIKEGKPLQITNPNMTRFLLTLPDAVDLVLETLERGESSKIYIRRSPACTIETLAMALSEIFNYPYFKVVGMRTGEKVHETLVASEMLTDESLFTSENTRQLNVSQTKKLLLTVPEIQEERREYEKRQRHSQKV